MALSLGQILALSGAVLAVVLGGLGSAIGCRMTGQAAAGVTSEDPDLFGKLLVIELLPGTQGIYGFLIGLIVLIKTGFIGGSMMAMDFDMGLRILIGCLPTAIVCLISAILQGQVAVSAINMVGVKPETSGKGITMAVTVETYAVLALLASFLMVWFAY